MRLNRRRKAVDAATFFLKKCSKLMLWEPQRPESTVAEIMDFRWGYIATRLAVQTSCIPSLMDLNWATPCLVPSNIQDTQISVLSWASNENMQSAAVVINPVFTYNKGKLHLEEGKLDDLLAKGNHNLDCSFLSCSRRRQMTATSAPWCALGILYSPSTRGH